MSDLLGIGLYSPRSAAYFLRMSVRKLRRWMYGTKPVITPQLHERDHLSGEPLVTFSDLVQALIIGRLREQGVSMGDIRQCSDLYIPPYQNAFEGLLFHPDGTIVKWTPFPDIELHPAYRWGQPRVMNCGCYPFEADTLWTAADVEGVEKASRFYSVPVKAIQTALAYREWLET